ncbi:MAG: peptide chain release factor N(5)-glutamine methyltransferase [Bacillota bacterium]
MSRLLLPVAEVLAWGEKELDRAGVSAARLEAEVLLAFTCGWSRSALLARLRDSLEPGLREEFSRLVARRSSGYPLQYITGRQEFMSLDFLVAPGALIPRGDTEVLVEEVLDFARGWSGPLSIVDVGTGTGAIAVSLARYLPASAQVFASDVSKDALVMARENARRLGVKVTFVEGDLLHPFLTAGEDAGLPTEVAAIASNPPYIPSGEFAHLPRELAYEPVLALDGGPDGMEVYRRLIPQAAQMLPAGGLLALEIGWNQASEVIHLLGAAGGFNRIKVRQDLAGRDRVVTGRRS